MAQASTCSSSARIASLVNCGATGSSHTDRPSEARRVTRPGGSRSTQASITRSQARSRAAAQRCPDNSRHGWLEITDRSEHIGPGPRRTRHREPIDDLVDGDHRRRLAGGSPAASMAATSRLGVQSSSAASAAHRVRRSATPLPVLWARVSADASRHSAARSQRRRVPPLAATELADLDGQRVVDLAGAFGEHLEQLPGQAGDLGLTVDDRLPRHPVAVGQLGPQHRLVQAAQHPLMPLQVAGVQRQPPAVVGLDLGRDDGVGVHLRVIGPRRRLAERRHRQPERVGMQAAAVDPHPGRRPEPLQMRRAPPSRRRRARRADRDHR